MDNSNNINDILSMIFELLFFNGHFCIIQVFLFFHTFDQSYTFIPIYTTLTRIKMTWAKKFKFPKIGP